MARYLPGQVAELMGTFRNAAGVLANPTTVTVSVRKPDGTSTAPTASSASTGIYTTTVTLDQVGVWYYTFTGTNPDAIDQGTLVVREALTDLLTVTQLREHITTELGDDALQRILDANEDAIVAWIGAPGSTVEVINGGYPNLVLRHPAATITSIVERVGTTDLTLATDDYRIRAGGYVLERLGTGTNARGFWDALVTVTYARISDIAQRIGVLIELCRLDVNRVSGLASQSIGDWSESYRGPVESDRERSLILGRLAVPGMRVV